VVTKVSACIQHKLHGCSLADQTLACKINKGARLLSICLSLCGSTSKKATGGHWGHCCIVCTYHRVIM